MILKFVFIFGIHLKENLYIPFEDLKLLFRYRGNGNCVNESGSRFCKTKNKIFFKFCLEFKI
jgi:hypothetical protein